MDETNYIPTSAYVHGEQWGECLLAYFARLRGVEIATAASSNAIGATVTATIEITGSGQRKVVTPK